MVLASCILSMPRTEPCQLMSTRIQSGRKEPSEKGTFAQCAKAAQVDNSIRVVGKSLKFLSRCSSDLGLSENLSMH